MPPSISAAREPLNRAIREISTATKVVSFYPAQHPAVRVSVDRFLSSFKALTAARNEIELGFADAGILYEGEYLQDPDRALQSFATFLLNRSVAQLTLRRGLDGEGLTAFLRQLALEPSRISEQGGLSKFLQSKGITAIAVSEIDLEKILASEADPLGAATATEDTGAWKRIVADFLRGTDGHPSEGVKTLVRDLASEGEMLRDLMGELGAQSPRDLPRLMGRLAGEISKETPESLDPFLGNLGEALMSLPLRLRMDLILNKVPLPDGTSDLMTQVCERMTDPMIVELVSSFVETERQLSPRLFAVCSKVFNARGRSAPYFGEITARLQQKGGGADLGRIWQSLQGLLVESDQDYLSETYKATLDTISRQPEETDSVIREALESAPGFAEAFLPEAVAAHACRVVLCALDATTDEVQAESFREDLDRRVKRMSGPAAIPLISEAVRVLSELRGGEVLAPGRAAMDRRVRAASEQVVKIFRTEYERLGEEERGRATQSFKELGGLVAQALLDGLAEEENWEVRRGLLNALAAIGRPAVPLLLKRLSDSSWYLVRNAAMLLGQIGGQSLVDPLAGLLQHEEPRVRREAATALGKIGGPRAVAHLRRAVLDADVGTVAARVLGEIDRENTIAMFSKRLARAGMIVLEDGPAREAITVLGEMEAAEAVPILSKILGRGFWLPISKGDGLRVLSAQALKRIGTAEAMAALQSNSRSARRAVRETCESLVQDSLEGSAEAPAEKAS
ncbi:MAG TPA: HEAT repeat domain-containing protein [Candidatus Polarisedimenticolia bacterium]|jgi:HEAT repeat protein|nr:HEAT repeat domain-containing protein [Candidatus Polarisedimenticolia bacterium]